MLLTSNETTYHQIAMICKVGRHRSLRLVSVELAIYLAILLIAPFAHHDLDCPFTVRRARRARSD